MSVELHSTAKSQSDQPIAKGEMTLSQAGKMGGNQTKARHGSAHFQVIGTKGSRRMQALVKRGLELQEAEK